MYIILRAFSWDKGLIDFKGRRSGELKNIPKYVFKKCDWLS